MKPEVRERPFTKKDWVFELKYDGFRLLAEKIEDDGARLAYRSGRDASRIFPEITRALIDVPFRSLLVDGEAVILDDGGRPDFQRLQRRAQRTRAIDVERAAAEHPAVLFVFDLLSFEGYDLRPLPLSARKAILRRVLPPAGLLRYVDDVAERGEDFYAAVAGMGLEGIVAKRADSPYRGGYSSLWLKIRVDHTADFAIVGYEPGPGGLRCLHLAFCDGPELVYAGTVGSGFDSRELREIRERLEPARRPDPAAAGAARAGASSGWSPSWSARCATRSGPAVAVCANRFSCGCARTSASRNARARIDPIPPLPDPLPRLRGGEGEWFDSYPSGQKKGPRKEDRAGRREKTCGV